jgi:hypothetical protein
MLEEYFKSMEISDNKEDDKADDKADDKEIQDFADAIDNVVLNDNEETKVFNTDKCMCRIYNNGIPKQCNRKYITGTIYCKMHFKIIEEYGSYGFGLMNEDIPTHHIPGSKNEGKRIKKRKCTNCGELGHNKQTCIKNDIVIVKKEVVEEVIVKKEVVVKEVCVQCKFIPKDNKSTIVDDNMYCYTCYKVFIEKCKDCNNVPCDCDTELLSDIDRKECEDLMSEDTNEYIYFQGIHYYYDRETNIIAFDYKELGIWNPEHESVDWYDNDCENIHKSNSDYNP